MTQRRVFPCLRATRSGGSSPFTSHTARKDDTFDSSLCGNFFTPSSTSPVASWRDATTS